MGLKEQIQKAKSMDEIVKLLENGLTNFTYASIQTKNSWKNVARRRGDELSKSSSKTSNPKSEKQNVRVRKTKKSVKTNKKQRSRTNLKQNKN